MSKAKHECAYCGEMFVKIFDHMTHVMKEHDTGYKPHAERLRRPVTCWGCNADIQPPQLSGRDWYICDCGWELPRNWVNGQLVPDADGVIK